MIVEAKKLDTSLREEKVLIQGSLTSRSKERATFRSPMVDAGKSMSPTEEELSHRQEANSRIRLEERVGC